MNTARNVEAAIAAQKKIRPKTVAEARSKSIEIIRLAQLRDAPKPTAPAPAPAPKRVSASPNVTHAELDEILKVVAREYHKAMNMIQDRLIELEKEAAELKEQQKEMLVEGGIWREGQTYRRNAEVTHDGTIWVAKEANAARPGKSDAWRMKVKTKGGR